MKVYKFGGASVKDANGVRNLKEIVAQASDDLMVVISAMGKTTNALERVVAALTQGDDQTAETEWLGILDQHVYIMQDLGLQPNVDVRLPMMPEYNQENNLCYQSLFAIFFIKISFEHKLALSIPSCCVKGGYTR